jgi:hypothetical protein
LEQVIKEIQDARKESFNKFNPFLILAERDQKVALGDQWEEKDKKQLNDESRPILNINLVGKGCRMISAQQRQNPMDIAYYPVDSTDQEGADVYTKVVKWLFTNGQYNMPRSLAFDDTIHTGIGWLAPEMNYDYDPLFGDILLNHESIYSILPDPYLTKMTLDDCDWIVRQKYLSKSKCINNWKDFEKDIELLTGGKNNEFVKPVKADENKLLVCEKWKREYEDVIVLINPQTLDSIVWKDSKEELQALMESNPALKNFQAVKRSVPVIKLQIAINDELLIYDDVAPEGYSRYKYPFIPIWGFFTPHFNEENWSMKLAGYARMLIDSQREKNKTRSILMDGLMRSMRGKLMMEEGAIKNPDSFASGKGDPIIVNSGMWDKFKESTPPVIDMAMVQLEQMHSNDMKEMGLNPDLLQVEGGSAASAPTSSLQLRREQGMMSVQQLFDNLGLANRMLGLYNIDLINMWPAQKIEKIIGQELPQGWEQRKENTRYDCVVDEKTSSPTYRKSVFNDVLSLVQHGAIPGGIPPTVARALIDMPSDIKKPWDKYDKQQAQQAQQAQQMQMQMQQQMAQIQIQVENMKQQGETMRLKMEEMGENERQMKQLMNDLAIAKLKNKQKTIK